MRTRSGLFALAMILLTGTVGPSSSLAGQDEQTIFSMEQGQVERAVAVPSAAMDIIKKDDRVLTYLEAEGQSPADLDAKLFLASEIHLRGPNEIDLIIIGTGRLRGANVTPFWIFRKLSSGYKLVLRVNAHDLRIENTRKNGFKEIVTGAATALSGTVTRYGFAKGKYQVVETHSEPNG